VALLLASGCGSDDTLGQVIEGATGGAYPIGTGGGFSSGGGFSTGGGFGNGGGISTGGGFGTGGALGSGGLLTTGGATGVGGTATGGAPGTGGAATGGAGGNATGGAPVTDGSLGTGGTTDAGSSGGAGGATDGGNTGGATTDASSSGGAGGATTDASSSGGTAGSGGTSSGGTAGAGGVATGGAAGSGGATDGGTPDGGCQAATNTLVSQCNNTSSRQGFYLDLEAITDVTVTELETLSRNTAQGCGARNVSIYYRPGTYLGFERNASAWTLLGSTTNFTPTCANACPITPTPIPIDFCVTIPAGQKYGFYVVMTGGAGSFEMNSSGAANEGNVLVQNANLRLIAGKGQRNNGAFQGTLSNDRGFQGTIHYRP
jgi:hypothetical protein